jgi:phage-related protein
MPAIAPRCHEPRIRDRGRVWRIVYRLDSDAVLILEIFDRKTTKTPRPVSEDCRRRLRHYDERVR